ncbi:hypothetical protein RYX36_008610 [Vicia faba]
MSSSPLLPSNMHSSNKKFHSILSFFCSLNTAISCGTTLYCAYNQNDIPMIIFVIFVYSSSFLLNHWSNLYHKLSRPDRVSSKGRNIKIGTWILLSIIMLGFACEFSTFMSFYECVCICVFMILGNGFIYYLCFVWEGCKSCGSKSFSIHYSWCTDKNAQYKDFGSFIGVKGLDFV